jgi:hypothetical protein
VLDWREKTSTSFVCARKSSVKRGGGALDQWPFEEDSSTGADEI